MNDEDEFEVESSILEAPSTELCVAAKTIVRLPVELMENKEIFSQIINLSTWNKLSNDHKKHLMKYLPTFKKNNCEELQKTLRMLFQGSNFKFGNPLSDFFDKLHNGHYHPEIQKYLKMLKLGHIKESKLWSQRYNSDILSEIILNRQLILEYAYSHPFVEPLFQNQSISKFTHFQKKNALKCKMKFHKVIQEVQEECNAPDTSASEDDEPEENIFFLGIPTKQLVNEISTTVPSDQIESEIISTLDSFKENSEEKTLRPENNTNVSEDDILKMLKNHRKRKACKDNTCELDTGGLTLEGIVQRTQTSIHNFINDKTVQKAKRRRNSNQRRKSIRDENTTFKNITGLSAPFSFFCLIRDIIKNESENRITASNLEQCVIDWEASNEFKSSPNNAAFTKSSTNSKITSALKFLAVDALNVVENFIPYVDFKERAGLYVWIGDGRDSDKELETLCQVWMEKFDEWNSTDNFNLEKTSFKVRQSTDIEKIEFRKQENKRFANAHLPFTYKMHGYSSVVGPVKRVFQKDEGSSRARDHSLLTKDRPHFVTILTLVRDAVARLPNGEGTRADICELLKDSQYVLPNVSDTQINAVVSGALDRLHYERDPCIKFEIHRKVWVYLHRGRTEENYEKLHRAQEAALKARKALIKPKLTQKGNKEQNVNMPHFEEQHIKQEIKRQISNDNVNNQQASVVAPVSSTNFNISMTSPIKLEKVSSSHGQLKSPEISSSVSGLKLNLGVSSVPIAVVSTPQPFMKPGQLKTVQLSSVGSVNLINLQGQKLLQVSSQSQNVFNQLIMQADSKKDGMATVVRGVLPSAPISFSQPTGTNSVPSTIQLSVSTANQITNRQPVKHLTVQQLSELRKTANKFNLQKFVSLQNSNSRIVSIADSSSIRKTYPISSTVSQPIIIGGKTIQLTRKPIQVPKSNIVHLSGKTVQLTNKQLATIQLVNKQPSQVISTNAGQKIQLQSIRTEKITPTTVSGGFLNQKNISKQ